MKKICSSCGEEFEGVVCTNCGKGSSRNTIITVSRPVSEDEIAPPPQEASEHTLKILQKRQHQAQKAEEKVRRLENREEKRSNRSAKREHRLVQSENSTSKTSKVVTQFRHVLSLSITGATRQAIHFVISPRGKLAFILLIPLCLLIPLIISISCTIYFGVETSPQFVKALGETLVLSGPAILKGILFWFELCAAMVIFLRAHAFAINSALTLPRAVGLVCVAQMPALYLSMLFAVCLFVVPVVSLLLAILAVFQFIIMIFIGVEFAAMDKKRGVFTSFSVMLLAYICAAAAITALNFPAAADYITALVTKIYI